MKMHSQLSKSRQTAVSGPLTPPWRTSMLGSLCDLPQPWGSFPLAKSYLEGEAQGADWTGAAGVLM